MYISLYCVLEELLAIHYLFMFIKAGGDYEEYAIEFLKIKQKEFSVLLNIYKK
jgi:hypothetical protein